MSYIYTDIETSSLDSKTGEIVCIQTQELDMKTGEPLGPLKILPAWATPGGERGILERFGTQFFESGWRFVPVGCSLSFEATWLFDRCIRNDVSFAESLKGLPWDWFLQKPKFDIQPILVLMNKGAFRGASLERFSAKPTSGHAIIEYVERQQYDKILEYVRDETSAYLSLLQCLLRTLPDVWSEMVQPVVQG